MVVVIGFVCGGLVIVLLVWDVGVIVCIYTCVLIPPLSFIANVAALHCIALSIDQN